MIQKIKTGLIGLLLILALAVTIGPPAASYAQDSGAGFGETTVPFSVAITAGTPATVISATASRAQNIRSITITNTASGFVRLYSKPAASVEPIGADLIFAVGVIANTPLILTQDNLRGGVCGRVGEAIQVDATTGTVSMTMSVRQDQQSPKH